MPAKDNVIVRMSAEDAGAFDAWRKAAKGPEAMGEAIEKAGKKGNKYAQELGDHLAGMAGHWISVLGAIEAVRKAADAYFKTLEEHRNKEESSTRTIDTGMAGYAKAMKLKPGDIPGAAARIGKQGALAGATPEQATAAAKMLGEFQYSNEEATGDALGELLKFQNATGAAGGDSEDFSRQVLEINKRSGGKHDAASIKKLGAFVTHLTGRAAGFDSGMLKEYSAVADAAAKSGVDTETGLAMYAALREHEDKPKTAIKTFKEWMKPGMQKGEAEARKRAAELKGKDAGISEYDAANQLDLDTLAKREQAAKTQETFNEYKPGILSHELAHSRLTNALRDEAGGKYSPIREPWESKKLDYYEWANNYDTDKAVHEMYDNDIDRSQLISKSQKEVLRHRRDRILGAEQIPGQGGQPPKQVIEHRFKGQDGRAIPVESRAVGVQGR